MVNGYKSCCQIQLAPLQPGSLACFQKMYIDLFDEHEHFYVDATMSLPVRPFQI
jgi:hypothetical protein